MKTITDRNYPICKMVVFFIAAVLLSGSIARAEDPLKGLRGEAFSDPSQHVQMPADWVKQPIKYEEWAGKADIVIALNQQIYYTFLPIIKNYGKEQGLNIVIREGTCGNSAGMLVRKAGDMGMFCCPPGKVDRLPGLRFHTLGIMAIALLVHPDNPIDNVTIEQARKIFQGEINRWSELRDEEGRQGPNLSIRPVGRLHCKKRAGHWRLLLDNEDLFSPKLQEVGAIPDMISLVSAGSGAIGYETLWMAHHRYKEKGRVKALKIDGHGPKELDHLVSNRYPLYRVFSITTWEGEGITNPHAQKLVDYLLQKFEHLDSKLGIIPVSRLKKAGWKFKGDELIGEPE